MSEKLKLTAVMTFKTDSFDTGINLEDEVRIFLEGFLLDSFRTGEIMNSPHLKIKLRRTRLNSR